MQDIRRILVAVELDEESENVIEYGITLGVMLSAKVRCVHVSRPEIGQIIHGEKALSEVGAMDNLDLSDQPYEDMDLLLDNDLKQLKQMVDRVMSKMEIQDNNVVAHVRSDFAVAGIIDEATEFNSDLIIVGAHVDILKREVGITNLSKDLINRTNRQIIVVPSSYGNRNLDHIAMFINFSFSELAMIQNFIDVSVEHGLQLSFFHILEDESERAEIETKLNVYRRLFLKNVGHAQIKFICQGGVVPLILEDLSGNLGVDLIVIRAQKKHWNLFGLNQTINKKVLNHTNMPLYVWQK